MRKPLWEPDARRIASARLTDFTGEARDRSGLPLPDYAALHRWSIEHPEEFWDLVWSFAGVIADARGGAVLANGDSMLRARFFPEARLNFAENLLRRRGSDDALVFRGENRVERRLSWDELHDAVGRLTAVLSAAGVGPGDRVAGLLPNLPEAVIGMLATASLGAVWTSCSPDFGVTGVVDRFGQTEPVVLLCADGYFYKGRPIDSLPRVRQILEALPSVRLTLVVPYVNPEPALSAIPAARNFDAALADVPSEPPTFTPVGFNDPLYVLYSSGTTGPPKGIVHGVGGTLLKHLAEHQLMCDIRAGDRVFYFTTCGWMMWNWLATALASEATLLLYDGNPMYPDELALFEYASSERCTLFGTSAKFIDALVQADVRPGAAHDLSELRTVTSTGSPLAPAGFDFVYERVARDVCLSSIAGGTDIVGCFVGGNPTGPVWRGEIQAPTLGMAVDVFDAEGRSLRGEKGELVCTRPFPSMPIGFWNDPDGSRYRGAYFERYPGIWHHGDYVEATEHGGFVIHGRSDATLNPGGVRIGTAEIYRVVDAMPEVVESVVIGQDWQGDVRVVLFVRLAEGEPLSEELARRIAAAIREQCSPRHVPAVILAVADIPRTRSGKLVELAVRDAVHGREIRNLEALANPEALAQFRDRPELESSA